MKKIVYLGLFISLMLYCDINPPSGGGGGSGGGEFYSTYVTITPSSVLENEYVLQSTDTVSVSTQTGVVQLNVPIATNYTKGVAKFNSSFFNVSNGDVLIKPSSIGKTQIDFSTFNTDDITEGSIHKFAYSDTFRKSVDTLDNISAGQNNVHFTSTLASYLTQPVTQSSTPTFNQIILNSDPSNVMNVATKHYIDSVIMSLKWKNPVIARVNDHTQVETANVGDRYIFLQEQGHENDIAQKTQSGWDYTDAETGLAVYCEQEIKQLVFGGTSWVALGSSTTGSYSAGAGINISGDIISVDYDNTVLGLTGNSLTIKNGGIKPIHLTGIDTDDILEGTTNLYYTNDRVGAMIDGNVEENITVTYANGKLNFSVPVATTTIKGVSSFSSNDFDVVSGVVSIKDKYLLNTGDTGTGNYDFASATIFKIPANTSPDVSSSGTIAIDTNGGSEITQGILQYHDGTRKMNVVALDTLPTTDGYAILYDAVNKKWKTGQVASGGGGGGGGGGSTTKIIIPLIEYSNNSSAYWARVSVSSSANYYTFITYAKFNFGTLSINSAKLIVAGYTNNSGYQSRLFLAYNKTTPMYFLPSSQYAQSVFDTYYTKIPSSEILFTSTEYKIWTATINPSELPLTEKDFCLVAYKTLPSGSTTYFYIFNAYIEIEVNVGGGSVAGNNKTIQYNNNGTFAGDDNLIWDSGIKQLTVSEKLAIKGTTYHTLLQTGNQTANITYTLPSSQGSANTYLKNDGSGNLSWSTVSGGGGQTLYDCIVAPSGGDYTTLESALAAGKKKIFIRSGTYNETSNLTIPAGSIIVGEHNEEVNIVMPDIGELTLSSNVRITNVKLSQPSALIICQSGCSNIVIDKCKIFMRVFISDDNHHIIFSNNYFQTPTNDVGIRTDTSTSIDNILISNNVFKRLNHAYDFFYFSGYGTHRNIIISNNSFYSDPQPTIGTDFGFEISAVMEGCILSNNTFYNSRSLGTAGKFDVVCGNDFINMVVASKFGKKNTGNYPSSFNDEIILVNLCDNAGFEIWQRGTSFVGVSENQWLADRWQAKNVGTVVFNVARENAGANSKTGYSMKVVKPSDFGDSSSIRIEQRIDVDTQIVSGKTVYFSGYVKAPSDGMSGVAMLYIKVGTSYYYSSSNTKNNDWDLLSVSAPVSTPSEISVGVEFSLSSWEGLTGDAYLDNFSFGIGSSVEFQPLATEEDLARCWRWYQPIEIDTNVASDGTNLYYSVSLPVKMSEKGTLSVNDIPSGWSDNTSTRKALKLTKSGTSTERLQGTVWLEINP